MQRLFGQQSNVRGTVLDQNNAPISFVTVLANNVSEEKGASGAVFAKGTTTDDFGKFHPRKRSTRQLHPAL